jgi:hypothetical protein
VLDFGFRDCACNRNLAVKRFGALTGLSSSLTNSCLEFYGCLRISLSAFVQWDGGR